MIVNTLRLAFLLLALAALQAQDYQEVRRGEVSADRVGRWALVLEDPPVTEFVRTRAELEAPWAYAQRSRIESAQRRIGDFLKVMKIPEIGSVQTLADAVFVVAHPDQVRELAQLPGVVAVVPMQPIRRTMNRAASLVKAPQAWTALGGSQNAGLGMKIGIIDTGIDDKHAAFQDSSLPALSGYPKCRQSAGECDYANRKIIAVRSYVDQLAYYFPDDTRPDDFSPRDRVGHGTAVAMAAAGVASASPIGQIQGIAPRAYLGNYKIFGSPGVNDLTFTDVIVKALDDAFNDGMDVVNFSIGFPAEWAPSDAGSICNKPGTTPCDLRVDAVQRAVARDMSVVVAAGNDGDSGQYIPSQNTINSPATAPNAITVGATQNSHRVLQKLSVTGAGVPSNLATVKAMFGNGPRPVRPITAPLRDVAGLQNDGKACQALTNGSLTGAFALVAAGGCSARTKVNIAQAAGAAGVVLSRDTGLSYVFSVQGLEYTGIPLMQIGYDDGQSLRQFLSANTNRPVTLDPTFTEYDDTINADLVAVFTSYGPSIGSSGIKPELVAPATDIMTATQKLDPNGDMFDASGYTSIQGTSFAAPIVTGAVALVKQKNPSWTPAMLKSAVVNTATTENVDDIDNQGNPFPARVAAIGAGKLDVNAALQADVTVDPPVVSFGVVGSTLPSVGLTFRNASSRALTLRLTVKDRDFVGTRVTITPASFSLNAGATSQPVTVALSGARPAAGVYEGYILVEGGTVPLRVPYVFLVGDNVPYNMIPLKNYDFVGVVNQQLAGGLLFKVVDRYGLPVSNARVRFSAVSGGGSIQQATSSTDDLGIAEATITILGPSPGIQVFRAELLNTGTSIQPLEYIGNVRLPPAITNGGVVNAASNRVGQGVAPGSYISIYGSSLSDIYTSVGDLGTPYLPYSLANVSVGFDVPGRQLSYPGRLHFVSDKQVNVQVPWELQGMTSVNMKVSLGDFSTAVYSVPLNDYSPAPFVYSEASTGRELAILTDAAYNLVTTANPAKKGVTYLVWANGLGPVSNQPASGEASPSQPLASTKGSLLVTIGGRPAQVSFSGLTPGVAGLYQINLTLDSSTPSGYQPLVITIGGVVSRETLVPVQ